MFGDERAVLQHALMQAVASARAKSIAKRVGSPAAPDRDTAETTRAWVALAQTMLVAGKITASESLLFSTFAVEALHTKRWLDHAYPEIEQLSAAINEIERAEGLAPDQYWLKDDGPEEHQRLNEAYSEALDERFAETLIEFGLTDLADLWREDRAEYDRRRKSDGGRRSRKPIIVRRSARPSRSMKGKRSRAPAPEPSMRHRSCSAQRQRPGCSRPFWRDPTRRRRRFLACHARRSREMPIRCIGALSI